MSRYLSAGTIFANRYRIERRIASGGMGDVYEVVHVETNRRRALKVLHCLLLNNDTQRARFRKEARLAGAVESEYIVDVSDAGIDKDTDMPFLVMELLRGEDLRARLRRTERIAAQETVEILAQVAAALDKTHQAHIVHRDLKPDNLFLTEREHGPPRVKLLDFGVAKALAEATQTGQTTGAVGTPLYMSPEQFTIGGKPSPATDVYALGLIAFTMLVGKPYWELEAVGSAVSVAFAMAVARGPQECASARANRYTTSVTLSKEFDVWFARTTHVNPNERYATAGEAVVELAKVLGVPLPLALQFATTQKPAVIAMTSEEGEPSRGKGRRGAMVGVAVGLVAATVLVGGAVIYWLAQSQPRVEAGDASALAPDSSAASPDKPIANLGQTVMAPSASVPPLELESTVEPTTTAALKSPLNAGTSKPVGDPKPKETGRRKHWSND